MGVDDAILRTLIVDNPRRILTLAAPEG